MKALFELRLTVGPDSIDRQGHVNNLEYVRWMQEAALGHSAALGWDTDRYLELGAGWVARSHWIEYLQQAYLGDEVLVYTWVANLRKIRSLRKYKMVRPSDETVLAVAETDWAFISYERRAPCRIPPAVADSFPLLPDDQEPAVRPKSNDR